MIQPQEHTLKVALCAIAKNENPYLQEWVEWYKHLGITQIFLYDNNDIDGEHISNVIGNYIESGFVKLIDVRGKEKYQLQAYIDFYNKYSKDYNWCCFFDIDEFLTLVEDPDICTYLKRPCFNDFKSIAINWKNYGDNGLVGTENNYDRHCLTRFTKPTVDIVSNKYRNMVYKKIIRGGLCELTQLKCPHSFSPQLQRYTCNNIGQRIGGETNSCRCNHNLAYLKHFCTKTILEYITKIKRGGGVNGKTKDYTIINFYLYNDKTPEKDNIIKMYAS